MSGVVWTMNWKKSNNLNMKAIRFEDGGPFSRQFADSESSATFIGKKQVDRCPSDDLEQYEQLRKKVEKKG